MNPDYQILVHLNDVVIYRNKNVGVVTGLAAPGSDAVYVTFWDEFTRNFRSVDVRVPVSSLVQIGNLDSVLNA